MQHKALPLRDFVEERTLIAAGSEPIHIDVFTSDRCLFCNDALQVARSAAKRLTQFISPVKVVETDVTKKPDLVEKLDIVALPTILVGNSRLIGIPTRQDIERLVHSSIFDDQDY